MAKLTDTSSPLRSRFSLPLWQNEQTLRHRWSPGSMSSSPAKLTDTLSPLESRFNVFLPDKINRHFVTVGVQVQCLPLWQNEQTLRHRWSLGSVSSPLPSSSLQGGDLGSRGIHCSVLPVGKKISANFIKTNLLKTSVQM